MFVIRRLVVFLIWVIRDESRHFQLRTEHPLQPSDMKRGAEHVLLVSPQLLCRLLPMLFVSPSLRPDVHAPVEALRTKKLQSASALLARRVECHPRSASFLTLNLSTAARKVLLFPSSIMLYRERYGVKDGPHPGPNFRCRFTSSTGDVHRARTSTPTVDTPSSLAFPEPHSPQRTLRNRCIIPLSPSDLAGVAEDAGSDPCSNARGQSRIPLEPSFTRPRQRSLFLFVLRTWLALPSWPIPEYQTV